MDLVHCIQCKFLVFPTLVARCLYFCKDAREPSGKIGNICRTFVMYLYRNDPFLAIYVNVSCHESTISDRRLQ